MFFLKMLGDVLLKNKQKGHHDGRVEVHFDWLLATSKSVVKTMIKTLLNC